MMKRALSTLGVVALLVCTTFFLSAFRQGQERPVPQQETTSLEEQVLALINAYRQTKNLTALQMNGVISTQAARHSADMATGKSAFGHDGFDDRVSMINKQLTGGRKFAENVAYGHLSAREVVDIWLNSPGHRHNIEGPYTLTGIGTSVKADGTIFFTQLFVAK